MRPRISAKRICKEIILSLPINIMRTDHNIMHFTVVFNFFRYFFTVDIEHPILFDLQFCVIGVLRDEK